MSNLTQYEPNQEYVDNRNEEILKQLPTPVFSVSKDFTINYMNNAGLRLLDKTEEEVLGKKCYSLFNTLHCQTKECRMERAIQTNSLTSARNEAYINGKAIPIEYHCAPLKNKDGEIVGGLEYIIDITEQVSYEERLREHSRQISTPTIKLWEGVLVLPIVGILDSMRAQYMMESMLDKISETNAKVVILDIQGVAAVDTAIANHLIKMTKATRLLGCECILSGISPAVAQTIIQLGIEIIDTIKTKSTLSDGLKEAFSILGMKVSEY